MRLAQLPRGEGYRLNVDAFLVTREALASLPSRRSSQGSAWAQAIDLGAGVGPIGLSLLCHGAAEGVTLVERDEASLELASRNALPFAHRARVVRADVADVAFFAHHPVAPVDDGADANAADPSRRAPCPSASHRAACPGGAFDIVVCNPPFTEPGEGRPPPEARRRDARLGGLAPFVVAASTSLAPEGLALFVYPAPSLARLLGLARAHGLAPRTLRFVHPSPLAPARVVLVAFARDGARAPLALRPPWFERDAAGRLDRALDDFLRSPPSAPPLPRAP